MFPGRLCLLAKGGDLPVAFLNRPQAGNEVLQQTRQFRHLAFMLARRCPEGKEPFLHPFQPSRIHVQITCYHIYGGLRLSHFDGRPLQTFEDRIKLAGRLLDHPLHRACGGANTVFNTAMFRERLFRIAERLRNFLGMHEVGAFHGKRFLLPLFRGEIAKLFHHMPEIFFINARLLHLTQGPRQLFRRLLHLLIETPDSHHISLQPAILIQ